ncbi:exodeoxyribonuclease [Lithospermum erythrorhizon]|uniref:Exonuclease 1 n=1 Tax=Lithospermum erythrorhizon TaxID=34254 RepID=A0AAV3RQG0_LITER
MGIKDLLRFMKPYIEPIHIKNYAGKRVGIDAYSWIHKGAYSCSMELCLNLDGEKKNQFINYFMHRINLLQHYKITPVVVFDGGSMPCKAATEDERYRKRKTNRDLAMAKLKEGNVKAAIELFQRAISVTTSMAHQLIEILKAEKIEFLVAPYEADAQLAYMSGLEVEKGGISAVISEDSDLLAYGCPAVIFKMDKYGNGEEIVLDKVFNSVAKKPSFCSFDRALFIGMCVFAGCDFLPSVPGIGIVKAHSMVSKYRNLDRALSTLKFEKGNQMPEDYSKSFKEAIAIFQHARIYDARSKQLIHIKPIPEDLLKAFDEELDFLGPYTSPSIATAIAEGNLDPCTMEAYPSMKRHVNPTTIRRSLDQPSVEDDKILLADESCFTVVSEARSRDETSLIVKQKSAEECKQTFHYEGKKHANEAITLKKLLMHSKNQVIEINEKVIKKEVMKVPDNNPFRKGKHGTIHVDFTDAASEVSTVVTEVEEKNNIDEPIALSKLLFPSKCEVMEVGEKVIKTELKVPGNNPFRKRNLGKVLEDVTNIASNQTSTLTEHDTSETLCVTPESQRSVNSLPLKSGLGKRRKTERKTTKCNSNESKTNNCSSILNFFSRI